MTSKLIIVLMTTISLIGCTTMRPMDAQRVDLDEQLDANDHVIIYENSGRIIDMTYIGMDDDRIRGRLRDGSQGPISVAIEDIEKMEIEKISGTKTTLAVVGGTVILVPVMVVASLFAVMGS